MGEGRKGEKALLVSLCPCTQHEQEVARHGAEKRGNHERLPGLIRDPGKCLKWSQAEEGCLVQC